MNTQTTIAILTPAGRGAVATIEVAGPRAAEIIDRCFHPANRGPLARQSLGQINFGRWGNEPAEEVVVCLRADDRVEIHCHGGSAASAMIVESLAALGCQRIEWQAAMAQTTHDPLAREAQIALAAATTERTALVLLDQSAGALRRAIEEIRGLLQPDETAVAQVALTRVLRYAPVGLHLNRPWKVVLAGPPNVGKSSLINALLGYRRALVYDMPGTTRDIVTVLATFDGWPVELYDTAGLRDGADSLEAMGIERAQNQLQQADVAVLAFDVSQPWGEEQERVRRAWPDALLVHNKRDLLRSCQSDRPDGLLMSAKDGTGIDELIATIVLRLVGDVPPPGAAVPFTLRQVQALQRTLASLVRGDRLDALCQIREL